MEKHKSCSFFGHRKVDITEDFKQKVKEIVEDLIINHNVLTFLFGSKSDFDDLCHLVVTELKGKYSKRSIGYYQPKSGTALAFTYAKQKKKIILNIFN